MTGGTRRPDAASVPRRALDARVRNVRGTMLVANGSMALELTDTAAEVWKSVDGQRTVADIARLLSDGYDVAEHVALADVTELLAELAAADLVSY